MVKDDSSDITFLHCLVVQCLCSLHHWTHKCALSCVMSGFCLLTWLWCPALWNSRRTVFYETGCPHARLKFTVNWSAVAHLLCLALQINARISWSWSMCFRPLLPFPDDVFPSEFHANITLDTVVHETSASSAVFVTEAPAKHTPKTLLFQNHWAMLVIIIRNQACAAFLYMTLSMLGCYLLN